MTYIFDETQYMHVRLNKMLAMHVQPPLHCSRYIVPHTQLEKIITPEYMTSFKLVFTKINYA